MQRRTPLRRPRGLDPYSETQRGQYPVSVEPYRNGYVIPTDDVFDSEPSTGLDYDRYSPELPHPHGQIPRQYSPTNPSSDQPTAEAQGNSWKSDRGRRYSPSLYYSYDDRPRSSEYRGVALDAAQSPYDLQHRAFHDIGAKRKPPVAPPFIPRSPSPSYITLSNSPPSSLSPTRKLLVLDLNGTLVFRPPGPSGKPRKIHPRPYMNVFAQFITLHSGLDTMVWSSAQPHNVETMVDRAFGPLRNSLKHVWARDTLGLSQQEFSRKVQTVKDLNILWRNLREQALEKERYSALNTVLLDDSALKAHLQPYNHLPLPEYDVVLRKNDLAAMEEEQKIAPGEPRQFRFDPSLLAVIGVLDELSRQDSVCAWIRADGLWAGFKDRVEDNSTDPGSNLMVHSNAAVEPTSKKYPDAEITHKTSIPPIEQRANSVMVKVLPSAYQGRIAYGRPTHFGVPPNSSLSWNSLVPNATHPMSPSLANLTFHEQDDSTLPSTPAAMNPVKLAGVTHSDTVPPNLMLQEIPQGSEGLDVPIKKKPRRNRQKNPMSEDPPPSPVWFSNKLCFEHWVARGTEAVEKLGIIIHHGLGLPDSPNPSSSLTRGLDGSGPSR